MDNATQNDATRNGGIAPIFYIANILAGWGIPLEFLAHGALGIVGVVLNVAGAVLVFIGLLSPARTARDTVDQQKN